MTKLSYLFILENTLNSSEKCRASRQVTCLALDSPKSLLSQSLYIQGKLTSSQSSPTKIVLSISSATKAAASSIIQSFSKIFLVCRQDLILIPSSSPQVSSGSSPQGTQTAPQQRLHSEHKYSGYNDNVLAGSGKN